MTTEFDEVAAKKREEFMTHVVLGIVFGFGFVIGFVVGMVL